MGLLDDVAAEPRKVSRHPQCIAGRLIATMSEEDQADLDSAFDNREFTHAAIHRVLLKRGVPLKREALARHRNRKCQCYEPRG